MKNKDIKSMKDELKKLQEALTQVAKYQMDEPDEEGEMARAQMLKTMKYAADIMNMIDDSTNLPAWVQSKLTKIAEYIGAVKHYMDSKTVRHVVTNMMETKEPSLNLKDILLQPVTEGLSPDIAKHMSGIHKGFVKVEGDGTMIYNSPTTAKKAADYLNSKKIAASSDGKYLYIESTINERATDKDWADTISQKTGTRSQNVLDFVKKHNLNIEKLGTAIGMGKIKPMDFITATSGNPGNPVQKKMVKMFGESAVEEAASSEEIRMAKNAVKNFAKYRRVPGEEAIYDLLRALKDVEREYKTKK
jgi:ElaB/YqjD/DUF883 family membrane-anchored ribosome-binding protein